MTLRCDGGVEGLSTLFPDTRPEAEAVLFELLRKAPAWRKLEMVGELNETVRTLALGGLRALQSCPLRAFLGGQLLTRTAWRLRRIPRQCRMMSMPRSMGTMLL